MCKHNVLVFGRHVKASKRQGLIIIRRTVLDRNIIIICDLNSVCEKCTGAFRKKKSKAYSVKRDIHVFRAKVNFMVENAVFFRTPKLREAPHASCINCTHNFPQIFCYVLHDLALLYGVFISRGFQGDNFWYFVTRANISSPLKIDHVRIRQQ